MSSPRGSSRVPPRMRTGSSLPPSAARAGRLQRGRRHTPTQQGRLPGSFAHRGHYQPDRRGSKSSTPPGLPSDQACACISDP